jgi:hypothetical protein
MWDGRLIEKIDECLGDLLSLAMSEMSKIISLGPLRASMVSISIVIDDIYGMSWPDCFVGGICCCALGEILTSLAFTVKDRVQTDFVQPWWSSQISFLNRGLWIFPLVRGSFTWSNDRDPPSRLRIDRFLISPEWEVQFPD